MHRARRSAVRALSLLCLFVVIGVRVSGAAAPETDDLIIGIEDIETFAHARSPHLRLVAHEIEVVQAERREALAWSNPALAYDHEQAASAREWQVTLQKHFTRPFSQGSLRRGWDRRVQSTELRGMQTRRDLVAALKTGYVQLRLLESQLARFDRLAGLVDLTAGVAGSRHAEGELSGLDRKLLRLAAYTVEAAAQRARSEHRQQLAAWRADMGIPAFRTVELATPIAFQPVDLDDASAYQGRLAAMPAAQAQATLAQALEAQADAARSGPVPGLYVYGGLKRFEPDQDGFVVGVAVDLPLFDRGAGEADRLRAERRIVENELSVDKARRDGEVAALVASLRDAQALLAGFAADLAEDSLANALLLSYREGAITLDDLLGAIQIEIAALEAHHADLAAYYRDIFRLEALTGVRLVGFAPAE
jgi:outer membrane protein, heavy metal efflux system